MDFVSTGHPKNRPGPRKYIHDHPWSSMRIRPLSGTKNAWHSSGNCSIRGFRSASLSLPRWWKQSTQQHTRASARLMADDFLLSMSTPNWKTLATNAHVTVKETSRKYLPTRGANKPKYLDFPCTIWAKRQRVDGQLLLLNGMPGRKRVQTINLTGKLPIPKADHASAQIWCKTVF